ncbi:hypothetical protein Y032_0212g2246 [Ancylostoma ceylanicum]|uniref:Uncharacterized protein n=1 Tax=Ancylostoma ceylanicum TaxID=53326 RepID=A0A016SKU9_9BILA|nr:hypothetical protein Y032_0212g2246 [Ancylostoma ceylanicum]
MRFLGESHHKMKKEQIIYRYHMEIDRIKITCSETTSHFVAPKLCNSRASPFILEQDRWTWLQVLLHLLVLAHSCHTVRPVSRCFPAFGRRRILLTPLDPSPGVYPLLDAGALLSHGWTRPRAFPHFWTPAHPYHTAGPIFMCFPAFGRRRTLITTLDPISIHPSCLLPFCFLHLSLKHTHPRLISYMLAEIDREGWAARARVEKKSDHYIYIRKAREKGCGEREVLSLQLSDCESDPDELPGQICDVQSVERHMEMLEHPADPEHRPPTVTNRIQTAGASEEENPTRPETTPQPPKEDGFTRARPPAPSSVPHRADVLYNWTPADRNLRYDKEATWRGRAVVSNEQSRRYNRCTGGFRDAALIQGSQW